MKFSRMDRIGSLMQVEIARIIDEDLDNPKLPEFITVSRVTVSKDLSQAQVMVTLLEDAAPKLVEETVKELNQSAGYIQRLLAKRIQLKRHPRLHFAYNPSTKYAIEMENVFKEIESEATHEVDSESSPDI